MKQYYPSSKILFDVAKIQKYLLAPGKPHYKEFYDAGYRRKDDVRLFFGHRESVRYTEGCCR